MEKQPVLQMRGITKRFGSVTANSQIDLDVYRGEILAILGENGCGKTTLMNIIAGIYYPDEGRILIDGREVVIRSPKDAFSHGIGMVHQHFKLVDLFTAAENITLGMEQPGKFNLKTVNAEVSEIADRYGFHIDPAKKIYDMSVSEKQTVEIIKVLYRGADILILDEPTAVLTPQAVCHPAPDEGGREEHHHHHAQAERGDGGQRPGGHPAPGGAYRIGEHRGNERKPAD